MLECLEIENLALFEKAKLEAQNGFTVLTGETGSGKSLLLSAMDAILGEKFSKDKMRAEAKYTRVNAHFLLNEKDHAEVLTLLREMQLLGEEVVEVAKARQEDAIKLERKTTENIEASFENKQVFLQDNEVLREESMTQKYALTLSREIKLSQSSSICRINGSLVKLTDLQSISRLLMDVHGQRANQGIFSVETHLKLLDRYASQYLEAEQNAYQKAFERRKKIQQKRKQLGMSESQRQERMAFLRFQLQELESLDFVEDEEKKLQEELQVMYLKKKVTQTLNLCLNYFYGESEMGALSFLGEARKNLKTLTQYFNKATELVERLERIEEESSGIAKELERWKEHFGMDELLLQEKEEKLSLLQQLKRKYGPSLTEVLKSRKEKRQQLDLLEQAEYALQRLQNAENENTIELLQAGRALRSKRKVYAEKLEKAINDELKELEMPQARFKVQWQELEIEQAQANGLDKVAFYIEANKKEGFKPLAQTASGGEAARIMLAIKSVLAEEDACDVLVFDEIDAGVSGKAAAAMGKKLKELSRFTQVFCVTHSAHLASMADHHFKIFKTEQDGRIYTHLQSLKEEERVQELTLLLAGNSHLLPAQDLARQLIEQAKEIK